MIQKSKNYTSAYIVFSTDISYMLSKAVRYKIAANLIRDKSIKCNPAFHLLSTLAIELFPKIITALEICLKYKKSHKITEKQILQEIWIATKKNGHNLKELYENNKPLMKFLKLRKVEEIKTDFVWQFEFYFNFYKENDPVLIKELEAIRYGSFARNRDILTVCLGDEKIQRFLIFLEEYVNQKMEEVGIEIKKYI